MGDDNRLAILLRAMELEREGIAFYAKAVASVSDKAARGVFRSLIGDEEGHLRLLQGEYDSLSGAGAWLQKPELATSGAAFIRVFPTGAAAAKRVAAVASDLAALQMAMDVETKGYDLYSQAARSTVEAAARSLYEYLAKMENRHFKILQDAYGYLTHPDHWYDDEEKPIFEGG